MKKRILSLLLVLVMLLGMLPTVALAAEDETPTSGSCGENVTWSYDADTQTLTISGTGPMTDYDSDTPEFGEYSEVVCISVKEGITSIGNSAFDNVFSGNSAIADTLERILLPSTLTKIGDSAFANLTNVASITIPEAVTSVGEYAF